MWYRDGVLGYGLGIGCRGMVQGWGTGVWFRDGVLECGSGLGYWGWFKDGVLGLVQGWKDQRV